MNITDNNKNAIVILHEIYGINQFMEEVCLEYRNKGFDVFCPDMLLRKYFNYSEAAEAYQYFMDNVGFDYFTKVNAAVSRLKHTYDKVFLMGFSVGATIAWRCCENDLCNGIICCYGSRIRDYLSLEPSCPVLLLFAEEDKFDVNSVLKRLSEKANVEVYKLEASRHGFMDQYSNSFDKEKEQKSKKYIKEFINVIKRERYQ